MPLPRRKPKTRPTFPDLSYKLLATQQEQTQKLMGSITTELIKLSEKQARATKHMIQEWETDSMGTMGVKTLN